MALDPSNSSNMEQLALKGLNCERCCRTFDTRWKSSWWWNEATECIVKPAPVSSARSCCILSVRPVILKHRLRQLTPHDVATCAVRASLLIILQPRQQSQQRSSISASDQPAAALIAYSVSRLCLARLKPADLIGFDCR